MSTSRMENNREEIDDILEKNRKGVKIKTPKWTTISPNDWERIFGKKI